MTKYKVLDANGCGPYSNYQWPKPTKNEDGTWTPGEWVEAEGELVMCENGIHYCDGEKQLLSWLNSQIYEIEVDGEEMRGDDKCIAQRGRLLRRIEAWNECEARLFACDCAEHVLEHFETCYPDDNRPREAIRMARRFANGEATDEERAAAWAAARDAAWAAARDAAWAAARAARAAARDAAWAAARAARDAAWAAERQWQAMKLLEYLEEETT